MKILLVEPHKSPITLAGEDVFLYEPLALEYLAAGVTDHHDVRILDLRLERDLEGTLDDFQPDIVGVTAYTVHLKPVLAILTQIKRWNPQVLTVVGGHHATVAAVDFISPHIDLVVSGEGVLAFQEIVRRYESCLSFQGIPGVRYIQGVLQSTPDQGPPDLDALPFPDRSLTARYRPHYYSDYWRPLASMRTSKGCPFRCNFCALWKLTGGRYLKRSPAKVVQELASLDEDYVFFADDESLVDASRMEQIAQMIMDAGIKKQFFLYGRADTIAHNPDLLALWRKAGLKRVFVGLEFFRDDDLQSINKRSTVGDNQAAVRIMHDLDIEIYGSFILRPEFTKQDFAAFRAYSRQQKLIVASFAVLTPLPGTDFYEEVKDQLLTHDTDFYDFIHTVLPTKLPLKEFYRQYARLYSGASPLSTRLEFLSHFPLKEYPSLFKLQLEFTSQLRNAYKDYENMPL